MEYYQLTYLIPDDFSEEEIKTLQEKIDNLIQKEEGILDFAKQEILIRKNLGYPIRNKQSVYLVSLNFNLDPGRLENLEKKLKAESKILRYMVLIKTETKPPTTFRKKVIREEPTISRKKVGGGKVELKEIEKKLEEILNE